MARPSSFTQDIADEICARIAKGESLRAICADEESGWLPAQSTVYEWLKANEAFSEQYTRAREAQADHYVDEIIAIADQPNVRTDPEGNVVHSDPQRDRLRVDTRKWVASKLAPKKYGDKQQVEHSGEVGIREWLSTAD
jgi:hypothetical protein